MKKRIPSFFRSILKNFLLYTSSVQFSIVFSFFILMAFVVSVIITQTYTKNTEKMKEFADKQVNSIAQEASKNIKEFLKPIEDVTKMSRWVVQDPELLIKNHQAIAAQVIGIFETVSQINSFTIAVENGDTLSINSIMANAPYYVFRPDRKLPENVKYLALVVERQRDIAKETYEYYDESGLIIDFETRDIPPSFMIAGQSTSVLYDPRSRPWYKATKKTGKTTWVDTYSAYGKGESFLTISTPILGPSGKFLGVVAAGIFVSKFSTFLKSQTRGFVASTFLFDQKGNIIAYSSQKENDEKEDTPFKVENIQQLNIDKAYKKFLETKENKIIYAADNDDLDDVTYFFPFPDPEKPVWNLGMVVIGKEFLGAVQIVRTQTVYSSIFLVLLSTLFIIFISYRIATPIQVVGRALDNFQHLKLDPIPPLKSKLSDIQKMIEGLNGLASGLRSFGKFIPKSLAQQLVARHARVRVGGEDKELTLLFTDIQDFTSISERLPRAQLAFYLSDYFEEMTRVIQENKGTVDKYIGDAIMAFWGAPLPNADHAYWTCKSALLCQRKLVTLNKKWAEDKKPVLKTRFGIGTGVAHVGNTGSSDRLQYTALGDCVNLSARLEEINKVYGTGILISEQTYKVVHEKFITRPVDFIAVKGQEKGGQIYELLEERFEDESLNHAQLIDLAHKTQYAYELYHTRHWKEALAVYKALQKFSPEDKLAGVFIQRCKNFIQNPPDSKWDGVFRMHMHV